MSDSSSNTRASSMAQSPPNHPPITSAPTVFNPPNSDALPTLKRYTSYTFLLAAPLLLALPPRKLDFYTFSLVGGIAWSGNFVLRDRTGRGVWERFGESRGMETPSEGAGVDERRARKVEMLSSNSGFGPRGVQERAQDDRASAYQKHQARSDGGAEGQEQEGGIAGMVKKVWMGDEKPGWKERRMAEEREALEEGRGYGGIIIDQIWEVWNWGKTDKTDDGDGDGGGGKKD